MSLYCGLCGHTIYRILRFEDLRNHKPDCKIFAGDRQLIEVIKGKDARHPNYNTNNPEDGN